MTAALYAASERDAQIATSISRSLSRFWTPHEHSPHRTYQARCAPSKTTLDCQKYPLPRWDLRKEPCTPGRSREVASYAFRKDRRWRPDGLDWRCQDWWWRIDRVRQYPIPYRRFVACTMPPEPRRNSKPDSQPRRFQPSKWEHIGLLEERCRRNRKD